MRNILRTAVIGAAAAILLTGPALATSASADALAPARGQFWEHIGFQGDKLDKDVENWDWQRDRGSAYVPDLTRVGRDCHFWCESNWNDQISSLHTTGGGQNPVVVMAYEHTNRGGQCLFVDRGRSVDDLRWIGWNDRISSFDVATKYDELPDAAKRRYFSCSWA